MKVRRITSVLIYIALAIAVYAGLMQLFGSNSKEGLQDFTKIETIAENFVKIYMTIDEHVEERKERIAWIAPHAASHLTQSSGSTQQNVELVKALRPTFSGDKAVVEVDVWTVTTKEVIEDDEKKMRDFPRRFMVTVIMEKDHMGGYFVSGLPLIRESELVYARELRLEDRLVPVKNQMMPVLTAFIPKLFTGDTSEVSNYLTVDAYVNTYNGEYEFLDISNVWINERSKQEEYVVDVDVKVTDVLLQRPVYLRINMILILKDGRYYVSHVT